MENQKVLYEVKDQIAWITINRPEVMNAINHDMQREIMSLCKQAEEDREVQVVLFRGAGEKAFSVGGDLKDRAREVSPKESLLESRQAKLTPGMNTLTQAVAGLNKPTIVLIHGYTIGMGLLLSLACDIRIAATGAKIGLSEVRRGFIPGSGGTQRLARIVGIAKALEICLSGELLSAEEAYRIGLVNRLVSSADELLQVGEQMAKSFLKGAPLALRYIKEAIYKGSELALEQGLRLEADLSALVMTTEDSKEGPRAFAEKREPVWKGK